MVQCNVRFETLVISGCFVNVKKTESGPLLVYYSSGTDAKRTYLDSFIFSRTVMTGVRIVTTLLRAAHSTTIFRTMIVGPLIINCVNIPLRGFHCTLKSLSENVIITIYLSKND